MSGEQDKPKPTLGSIARDIRTAAGWSRVRFAAEINLSLAMLTRFESGPSPDRLTVAQRQRIIRSKLMQEGKLHERALAAGIKPPVPAGPGDKGGGSDGGGEVES